MIVSISYNKKPSSALWYNFHKVQNQKANVLFTNNMPQGKDIPLNYEQALQ